jgi:hypothetical protein
VLDLVAVGLNYLLGGYAWFYPATGRCRLQRMPGSSIGGGGIDWTRFARGCILFVGIAAGVGPMGGELRLHLSEEGADAERLAMLTGYLRGELLRLDVEDVTALPAGEPPPGSRAFNVGIVGALLVALGQSAEGLRSVVSAIRDWLRRGEGTRRTVRLELDGDALELSQASAADQQRLIELFVKRHPPGEGAR